jgi:hypothetical protein
MRDNKTNALVKVEEKSLVQIGKRKLPKIVDGVKRIGKIAGLGSLSFLGLGAVALGNLPVATIGGIIAIGTGGRAIQNTLYKTEPSLMFISKNRNGEKQIFQDVRLNLASKMKDYNAIEKGGMMALQTLVGFSRYKENLKDSDYEIGENDEKIYCQNISTVTHGINLKTLKMIENLGYIKIDSMEDKFKTNIINKVLGKEPKGLRKLLIVEKIGFKNYADLKKIAKAGITGDKETLESMKKDFQKVTFRLTDKKIDFEELYKKANNLEEVTNKNEKIALKRLSIIFDNKQGILSTKNIDIGQDSFGRDIIKYNTKESFGTRMERKISMEKIGKSDFRDSLTKDVNAIGIEQRAMEKTKLNQEKSPIKENVQSL